MMLVRGLLAIILSAAPLLASEACSELTTMQNCVFAQFPGETCKWVLHHDKCLCTSSHDEHFFLPACDGNDPPDSSTGLDTNQVLMSVFIALTIVACGCCMCLLLLRPSGISLSTNAAELKPLAPAVATSIKPPEQYTLVHAQEGGGVAGPMPVPGHFFVSHPGQPPQYTWVSQGQSVGYE